MQDGWSPYPSIWCCFFVFQSSRLILEHNSYSANRSASHTVKWRTLRKACLLNSARDVTARRKMKYTSALRMKSSVIMAQILHQSSWPLEPPCLKVFLIFFQHVVALKTAAVTHALQYLHQPNLTEKKKKKNSHILENDCKQSILTSYKCIFIRWLVHASKCFEMFC